MAAWLGVGEQGYVNGWLDHAGGVRDMALITMIPAMALPAMFMKWVGHDTDARVRC